MITYTTGFYSGMPQLVASGMSSKKLVIDLLPIGNHACVSLRQSKFRVSFSLVYVDTELETHIPLYWQC